MAKGGIFRTAHPLRSAAVLGQVPRSGPNTQQHSARKLAHDQKYYLFVVADEKLPSGKLVRKLLVAEVDKKAAWANPELFGMRAKTPGAPVSIAEHTLGIDTNSSYFSTSTRPAGAPNIPGKRYYIDINKAKAAGVIFHEPQEILADLDRYARDNPNFKRQIEVFKKEIIPVEGEVLLEGEVPPTAIKTGAAMALTESLRVVQFYGVAMTLRDLHIAAERSFEKRSYKPFAAESVRQAGGWSGATLGFETGFAVGAELGSPTGVGALITGLASGLFFCAVGYYHADWIVKKTHLDQDD